MSVTPLHTKRRKSQSEWPAVGQDETPIHKSQENVAHFLRKSGVQIYLDAFASKLMIERAGSRAPLDDAALLELYFAADRMGLRPPKIWFVDCLANMAQQAPRNAVLEAINALVWDGKPRLDGWLGRHAGGTNGLYERHAFTCAWVAMVRRVRRPGVKFDQIVTVEGPQGCGKSTLLRIFARDDALFTDALPIGASDRDTLEIAHGKLIVELGELAGIGKRDLAAVKAFASRQNDRARLAYARFAVEVPRQFTIWGTTNDSEYLADPTGNRRFWPLRVKLIDLNQARSDVDQLWAEAAALEADGHPLTLPKELWGDAAHEQAARLVSDTWEDALADKLEGYGGRAVKVRTSDVLLAIGVSIERQDRQNTQRVAGVLRRLGFEDGIKIGKARTRGWQRGGTVPAILLSCDGLGGHLRTKGEIA